LDKVITLASFQGCGKWETKSSG